MVMPILDSETIETEGLLQAAKLMLISARTAPKSGGIDDIVTAIVSGKEKEALAEEMDKLAQERKIPGFKRDAQNLRDSEATVLVGVHGDRSFKMNCGACGCETCAEFDQVEKKEGLDFVGPNCLFKMLDLGIALGSAVKTASDLNVDNRVMYRVGTAARRLGLMKEVSVIIGIPMSAKGKSIYFDRPIT
jgi:uncharacterized ferredoxin-like protein